MNMITYLAVLKKEINLEKLKILLKSRHIRLAAHYTTIGVMKLECEQPISADGFQDYFLSVEEDQNNLTI
ncbi:hypothetical protein [Chryseobacterium arthrosphaerae]|uniref:hypothetical protein n=1 Tax=Chryseobacterium arthrosphaerae TaxID=651561 RepID=UPI001F4B4623|nr:hypothetical protein [Chryseobacterium arthrosphaerae]MDG4653491.1 hypothetical protein [Chryseobacterium arthrosphaerae]